ncbi:hypothetical protein GCM10018963_74480 [Saccharothrix longispora]
MPIRQPLMRSLRYWILRRPCRAVKEQELSQLLDARRFRNAPGIGSKYFSATPEGAALYARTTYANFPKKVSTLWCGV